MSAVLVIDDDPLMLSLMARLVELMGHSVQPAETGLAGLHCFEEMQPKLVITDLFMPAGHGDELIRQLRRAGPALKIIVVSGGAMTGDRAQARRLDVDAVIGKPFRVAEFVATVQAVLSNTPVC